MKDVFEPGKNCQSVATARRAAFLIDGADYYQALYDAFKRARRCIFIVGWDLHSEVQLLRGEHDGRGPDCLGSLLEHLAEKNADLHVYLLCWDFAMIYSLEREFFPRYKLKWRTHKRIHFCLDGQHPVGASQHQKIVVIDEAAAFVGGFDLSQWRWDTSAHRAEDPRRVDPGGKAYPPFHDVQMAVDGSAAHALGRLVRERWKRANGSDAIELEAVDGQDVWPHDLNPDMQDVEVAIARTLPDHAGQKAVREVEQLYLDSIAAAERFIYIENQYLSAHRIGQALSRRLEERDGPEVVIVLPEKTGGWLEQHTMDVLRGRILRILRSADAHGRLRTFYPRIAKEPPCSVMVHAKVTVIDDDFVRVGSANLSNRSMGLDSECDLAIAAAEDDKLRITIADFRNRLLAEHLGVRTDAVAASVEAHESLIGAIEDLRKGARTLVPLSGDIPPEVDQWVPESELLDPEQPVGPDDLIDHFVSPDQQPSAFRHWLTVILSIGLLLLLAALWRWTPAGEWLDMASFKAAGEWIRSQALTPLLVPLAYILGGVAALPVTLLVTATVIVFGPWMGLIYALGGSLASALVLFGAGRVLGRDTVSRFAGAGLNRISRKLSESGLTTVIAFRIIPVAPFTVINLIAGVSGIRLKDFALGTLIGMLPGVVAIGLLADRVSDALRRPDLGHIAVLAGAVFLAFAGMVLLRRWIKQKQRRHASRGKE